MNTRHQISALFIIVFLAFLFSSLTSSSQDQVDFDTNYLIGRWVLNSKDIYPKNDTIELIPYNAPQTSNLHPALKYAGIRFEKNGIFYQHAWNKCATGNPPDSYKGTWKITSENSMLLLSTIFYQYQDKVERNYFINSISKDKLVLIKVKKNIDKRE